MKSRTSTKHYLLLFLLFYLCSCTVYCQEWSPAFGNDGVYTFEVGNKNTWGISLALLDNKNVIVGVNTDSSGGSDLYNRDIYIYKLDSRGKRIEDFGINGYFIVKSNHIESVNYLFDLEYSSYDNFIYCLAEVEGIRRIFRIDTDGKFDQTFGNNGWVNLTNYYYTMTIQADGKIIVGSWVNVNSIANHILQRYLINGKIDKTFGKNGTVIKDLSRYAVDQLYVIKMQGNKIITVGNAYDNSQKEAHACIARYNEDGSIDSSFANNGYTITDIGHENFGVFYNCDVHPNGEIIAAGYSIHSGGTGGFHGNKAVLAKYDKNGKLMPSFNGDGILIFNSISGANDHFRTVRFFVNGDIVAGGSSGSHFPNLQSYYYLTKVNAKGILDRSFFNRGFVISFFNNGLTNGVNDLLVSQNDEIYSTGVTKDSANTHFINVVCKMEYLDTKINEQKENDSFLEILPNPCQHEIYIKSRDKILGYKIYSLEGEQLIHEKINYQEGDKINLTQLIDGVYYIGVLLNDGRWQHKKICKNTY